MTTFRAVDNALLESISRDVSAAKNPIPILKSALGAFRDAQSQAYSESLPVEQLALGRAEFIDHILKICWGRFSWDENLSSLLKSRISLIAVGGYGRLELLPSSDIDLLILTERSNAQQHASNIQSFLTLLWDIGLEVGHSVRSVKDSIAQSKHDVTVFTALLDCRMICGSSGQLDQLRTKLRKKSGWKTPSFFEAKIEEQEDRHAKSNHTEYSLEPNLKTAPGGLRDIQTIWWIAKQHYEQDDPAWLVAESFLERDEASILLEARNFLWQVRFALHELTGRDENRLLFDHQRKVADRMGYQDSAQLAVERFMQDYYRYAKAVSTVNEIVLQHFKERVISRTRNARPIAINPRFQSSSGYLEVTGPNVFQETPEALLEMFVLLGETPTLKGVRADTIRQAKAATTKIDDSFRSNPKATALFLDLLRVEHHLFSQLRRMNRYGILGAYLPEFERVVGQMQFDLFHIYTVDAHTLQVVRNMRRFRYKNQEQRFPIAAHIHHRLPKIELLYIAGFFHDLAKGQGGDHSELGIGIAEAFCQRHQLGRWDTNLVCWLVKNHLLMSTTAQRKDIFDPDIVRDFAEEVGDRVRLDYLYALTVADINATNPTLWNSWKASLMSQLYLETKRVLRRGVSNMVDREDYLAEIQNTVKAKLADKGLTAERIDALWSGLDDDYFLRESESNILWHTESLDQYDPESGPLILIEEEQSRLTHERGATHVFIHLRSDQPLFYAIVSAFDQLGMSIVDARIPGNVKGRTDYTFDVLDASARTLTSAPTSADIIRQTLIKAIDSGDNFRVAARRTPRVLKEFNLRTSISIDTQGNDAFTVLEVVAADRPGLLAKLARIFHEHQILMQAAKITTLGERVEDVFHIVDAKGQPLGDNARSHALAEHIQRELDDHIQELTA